jgi:DNA invertase Pin-like site-specific DNA recombinase
MRIGYARVSTDDQTLDLQRDALERAKCRKIYEEHASGKNTTRPELEACLKSLRTGDTLVVWRLDRLGRSLGNLIQLTNELQSRRVDLESLTEKLDTGRQQESLFFMCLLPWPNSNAISFASGPSPGSRPLVLVDAKVVDQKSSKLKNSKRFVLC